MSRAWKNSAGTKMRLSRNLNACMPERERRCDFRNGPPVRSTSSSGHPRPRKKLTRDSSLAPWRFAASRNSCRALLIGVDCRIVPLESVTRQTQAELRSGQLFYQLAQPRAVFVTHVDERHRHTFTRLDIFHDCP